MHMATAESQYQHENKIYNTVGPNNNNVLVSIKALVQITDKETDESWDIFII